MRPGFPGLLLKKIKEVKPYNENRIACIIRVFLRDKLDTMHFKLH